MACPVMRRRDCHLCVPTLPSPLDRRASTQEYCPLVRSFEVAALAGILYADVPPVRAKLVMRCRFSRGRRGVIPLRLFATVSEARAVLQFPFFAFSPSLLRSCRPRIAGPVCAAEKNYKGLWGEAGRLTRKARAMLRRFRYGGRPAIVVGRRPGFTFSWSARPHVRPRFSSFSASLVARRRCDLSCVGTRLPRWIFSSGPPLPVAPPSLCYGL